MRQAGRILPEYRKVRASVSGFKELVKTPELACEVTLQPVNLLGVDAAIIFSDILVVPEAMGLNYEMVESIGPIFDKTIDTTKDIDNIHVANLEDLEYVTNAIKLTRAELNNELPLIGFAGAPWTIFSYMLEGKGSKTFSKARSFLYCEPVASHLLLDKITDSTISYLKSQIKAGANIVQIFDSWAGILGPEQYKDFGIKYLKKICDAINDVPIIVFAKGANNSIDKLSNLNCEVLGLDWQVKIEDAQNWAPSKALQGNLDPTVLYADKNTIINHTKSMLQKFGNKGHIANLGHGVYPDTPLDGVKCFIDTVKGYNGPY
jgi:uroporphyrinogen decarboxylase